MDSVALQFEEQRPRLRRIALRMLGSGDDADDAVQEAWLRLSRADVAGIDDLAAWLTTAVSRACLDLLRARGSRRERPLELVFDVAAPDASVAAGESEQERAAEVADSVALALYVVMDELAPAERVAFVLHDVFGVPFDAIAHVLDRSRDAVKMLASRARRRLRLGDPSVELTGAPGREVVDAFFAAARAGDMAGLLRVLAPEVVMTARSAAGVDRVVGAATVAGRAAMFARPDALVHPAVVDGRAGVLVTVGGSPLTMMSFTVTDGVIDAIDGLTDPERLAQIVPSWVE